MNGLDDLRGKLLFNMDERDDLISRKSGWTLQGAIQSQIDIYASQATFDEVKRSFPYLVSSQYASGGGDVKSNPLPP